MNIYILKERENMDIVAKDQNASIARLSLGPYGTNSYIVKCLKTQNTLVVDAPGESEKVIGVLAETNPKYILMTHNHLDHIGGLEQLKSGLNIPVAAHISDADKLPVQPDILLNHNDEIDLGSLKLKVLHTPGHTPGSLCLYYNKVLLSGDTLFNGGPGKTGSPASFMQIIESLTNKVFKLPDDTEVFPGHGDSTTLKKEKEEYRVFSSKSHDSGLCGDIVWLTS